MLVVGLLAEEGPRDTGPDFGKASPFGLVVVVILLIGTFLLVWSMNRHLKKLPESFDPEHPEPDQAVDDGVPPPSRPPENPADGTDVSRLSPANALGAATSPYLRQHADNPVHWQQWTPRRSPRRRRATCRSCCRSDMRHATGAT